MKSIQDILSTQQIDTLVYVDDELGKDSFYDNAKGKIRQVISNGIQNCDYPFFSNNEIWEEEFEKWWNLATLEDVRTLANTYDIQMLIPNIAAKLLELMPKGFNVVFLAPEQFDDQFKTTLLDDLYRRNKNAIVLVDFDLEGYTYDGDRLLANIESKKNVFCGVFSQTFEMNDEIQKWEERQFNKNVYPLSKKRFDEDETNNFIIQGIKNIIWLKQINSIKELANNAAEKALATLKNGLQKIDPATFDRMVIAIAKAEGCWEFENLFRIIQIYLNKGFREEIMKKFKNFQASTKSLRIFYDDSQTENVNSKLIKNIQEEEIFENVKFINGVYSAVTNGDIFQIGNKYFILLGQPCNLAIREGKRAYQLDQAYLIPLEETPNDMSGKLLHPYSDIYRFALFTKRSRVSLSILDLVSYNDDGQAKIDINIDKEKLLGHEIMQENMLLRYEKIREKIYSYYQTFNLVSVGKNGEEKNKIASFFCKPFEMGAPRIRKKPTINGTTITFQIKRVGRYYAYGAHVLLQQFMNYMSRPEFPVDFNRC